MATTDPNVDFQGFVRETIAEQLAQAQQNNTNAQPTNGPLELTIAGQKYKYNSQAELESSLNNFVGAAAAKMQELENQVKAPKTTQDEPQDQGRFVSGNDQQDAWDDQEFVKRMTASPKEGLTYAFNQMFFNGQSEDPVADMRRTLQETELTKRTIAAYQFKENHPEFPGGQQFAGVIDQFRQQLNLPYDYNGIEAAYLIAINRGALPNFPQLHAQQQWQAQQQQQQQPVQQAPQGQTQNYFYEQDNPFSNNPFGSQGNGNPFLNQNGQFAPPPGVNRNNANFGPGVNLESLSLEQLEALAQRADAFRR